MGAPSVPAPPPLPAPAPDAADAAVQAARTMERRKQLGLKGRMSTYLTTAQGEEEAPPSGGKTMLGQ